MRTRSERLIRHHSEPVDYLLLHCAMRGVCDGCPSQDARFFMSLAEVTEIEAASAGTAGGFNNSSSGSPKPLAATEEI